MIETNCYMPEEIYADWLEERGFDASAIREGNDFLFLGHPYPGYLVSTGAGANYLLSLHEYFLSSPSENNGQGLSYGDNLEQNNFLGNGILESVPHRSIHSLRLNYGHGNYYQRFQGRIDL